MPHFILIFMKRIFFLALLASMHGIVLGQEQAVLPSLLIYQSSDSANALQSGSEVKLNTEALNQTQPSAVLQFSAPNGKQYTYQTDSITRRATGVSHWVAHLQNAGSDYRAIITYGSGVSFGTIATPEGDFRLETQSGQLRLLDLYAAQRRTPIFHSQPLVAPEPKTPPANSKTQAVTKAKPTVQGAVGGMQTIDLLLLYTNGLNAKLGADAVQARLAHLVAIANQAYIDSKVNLQLRLVHTAQVAYSDQIDHDTALRALTDGTAPFANIAELRKAYGADLVSLINQKDSSADSWCGLAWGLGYGGRTMNPDNAYSVVSVGDDIAGTSIYCNDFTLAHELGHNMGSAHDRANANEPGAYPYSYGYGIQGKFGDIMSYILPTVGKFSNPDLICSTLNEPCGVSESNPTSAANNALSLNNTAIKVAAFQPATGLDTTPDDFSFTTLIGATASAERYSEIVHISGLSTTTDISIRGGEYSINGGAFTTNPGQITNGQTVQVKLQSSGLAYAAATAMLTIGTASRAFRLVTAPSQSSSAPAIAAGFAHSLALRADATVWAWGDNSYGAVGDSSTTNRLSPVLISGLSNAKSIAAGGDFSIALKADGTVWGWGSNQYKQIGITASTVNTQPKQIAGLSNISKIAAGYFDSLAIDTSGNVWSWGSYELPKQITVISNASNIAVGNDHRMVQVQDGTVRAWGRNASGQLGIGSTSDQASPVTIGALNNITAVAAGEVHSLALRADGTVWAWGSNTYGQLGDASNTRRLTPVQVLGINGAGKLEKVVAIAAGLHHSMAILDNGSLLAWGRNQYAQIGDSSIHDHNAPVQVGLSNVASVAGFSSHSVALQADGSVWAWGLNNQGALGNGGTSWQKVPVAVGASASSPQWWIGKTDLEPAPLNLQGSSTGVPNSLVESQASTITGVNQPTPISIIGGQYRVDGGPYTAAAGKIAAGQTVQVQLAVPAIAGTSASAWLTIGGVTTIYAVTAQAPTSQEIKIVKGWNLLGNGSDIALQVASTLSNAQSISTVWKWLPAAKQWAFYAPSLIGPQYTDYIASKGYAPLNTIDAGEGYWVNASTDTTLTHSTGNAVTAGQLTGKLVQGWNLAALGGAGQTPKIIAESVGGNISTLWAWDNPLNQWYFYAPSLDQQGSLPSYVQSKNYLSFSVNNKLLGESVGFWLNKQ